MRIETIYPEEEIIAFGVIFKELCSGVEEFCAVPIFGFLSVSVCAGVAAEHPRFSGFVINTIKKRLTRPVIGPNYSITNPISIDFCAANECPCVEGPVEVVSAIDEMRCIVNELCRVAVSCECPR